MLKDNSEKQLLLLEREGALVNLWIPHDDNFALFKQTKIDKEVKFIPAATFIFKGEAKRRGCFRFEIHLDQDTKVE